MRRFLLAGIACTMLAMTACTTASDDEAQGSVDVAEGANPADVSAKPITIGYINQQGGSISYPEGSNAFLAAVDYVNADLGGVDGRPLVGKVCTVTATQADAVACANEMINDPEVVAVTLGGAVLAGGDAMLKTLESAGLPVIGNLPYNDLAEGLTNAYSIYVGSKDVGIGEGKLVASILEADRAAFLYSDNPGAQGAAQAASQELTRAGVEVKAYAIPSTVTDLSGTLQAVLEADPDVIMLSLVPNVQVSFFQAFKNAGLDLPVVTTPTSLTTDQVLDAVGGLEGLENTYLVNSTPSAVTEGTSEDTDILREALEKYGEEFSPGGWTVSSFGSVVTLQRVLTDNGGDTSKEGIAKGFDDFTGPVFAGPPEIDCPGKSPYVAMCTHQAWSGVIRDGKIEEVDGGWLPAAR